MFKHLFLLLISTTFLILNAETYKLDQLINHGIANSRSLKSQNLQNENSKTAYNSALADFLPEASYDYAYTNSGLNYSSSIGISKSISLNEPSYFNYQVTKRSKTIAELQLKDEIKKFVYNVFSSYLDALQTQKNIDILKENLTLQRRTYEQVMIQYNNNKKTIYDLQSSQIDTLSAYTDLLELQTQYQKQREDLFLLINMKDENLPFEDIELKLIEVIPYNENLQIRTEKINLEKEKYTLIQTELNLYPRLSLNYAYNKAIVRNSNSDILNFSEYKTSNTYGLSLSYPLFSYLEDNLNYRMKKRSIIISKNNFEDVKQAQESKYNQALKDLEIYKKSYEINQQKAQLAKTNLQIAEQRFNLGIFNLLDLDKSRIQYLQAQLNLNSKYYSLLKKQEEIKLITSADILNKW